MTIICRYTLIMILLGCAANTVAQTNIIDSLKLVVYNAKEGDLKLEAIIKLCDEYKSITRDTLDYYAFHARELAVKSNNRRLKQLAELAVAYDYMRWGWKDSTLFTLEPLIKGNRVTNSADRDIYFKASRLKAMSYATQSYYQEALGVLYQLVSEAEAYKDSLTLGENINTIGSIALARNQPRDALTWLYRALSFSTAAVKYKPNKAAIYVNMADAYHQSGKTDSANIYIDKGISLLKETQNISNLALALQRKSSIYIAANKFDEAENALKEMIAIRKQSGDSAMYTDDNLGLIYFYMQTKQVDKAIDVCKKALVSGNLHSGHNEPARSFTNSINIRLEYYQALARCYKIKGEPVLYQQTLEQIIAAKDSFYQNNSAQAIAELETKYEVQKKENTIIQQQLDITKKNNRFYTLLGLAFFITIISWLMFSEYRKREKLKLHVMLEKEKDLAVQSIAKAEENERKRIAADLHDNLGAYAASIVSNIDFITPEIKNGKDSVALKELHNNSQAIVSQLNDTIWALKKDGLSLTSISDRIKIFIQRIQPSYPHIAVNVIEQIESDPVLTPSQAFHLFRIMQEAISNALRHSKAKEIIISIENNKPASFIRITDNGTGIQQQNKEKEGGNGLSNMKERAREAGWVIEWLSNTPQGTSVILSSTTN